MDLTVTDTQEELRRSVREVLAKECPPSLVRAIVEGHGDATPLWRTMVELGWPALTIPEEHGGLGLGWPELIVVGEELGRAVAPTPLWSTLTGLVTAVSEAADSVQRAELLARVARGELRGSLAVAEAHGWELEGLRTTATRTADGWRLRGRKRFVLDATDVDVLAVAARVGDAVAWFLVDTGQVAITPLTTVDRSRPLAEVTFDDVVADPLGAPAQGTAAVVRTLEAAAVGVALETVGVCEAILDMTVAYAKVRRQFGRPIGSFQAVAHQVADAYVAIQRAQATTWVAALTLAEDDPRRTQLASAAKATSAQAARLLSRVGIQLHGGIGYTWEHDLHLYVKRALADAALFGDAAAHRRRVAAAVLG